MIIVTIQILLLCLQVYCIVQGFKKGDMFEPCYGFAMWGCIPIILLSVVNFII